MKRKIALLSLALSGFLFANAQNGWKSVDLTEMGFPLIIQVPENAEVTKDKELNTIDVDTEDDSFGYFIMESSVYEGSDAKEEALADVKLHKEVVSDNSNKGPEDIKFSRFVKDEPDGVIYENTYSDGEHYFEFYRVLTINGKNYLFESSGMEENNEKAFINTFMATAKTIGTK